jgi:hypothetical protein
MREIHGPDLSRLGPSRNFVSLPEQRMMSPAAARAEPGLMPCGRGGSDMRSIAVGGIIAALVMFFLGFLFYGVLGMMMYAPLEADDAATVQAVLGSNLPATGSYMVPPDEGAWMVGPSAVIDYVAAGGAPSMPMAMGMGYVHFLLSALLFGYGLRAVGGDFGRQARVVLWFGFGAAVFMHIGDPIWYGFAWRRSLFEFGADAVMMIAGGLVLARWFTSTSAATAPPAAATG